jgi:hypothetical protein
MQAMDDHNRRCIELIRGFKPSDSYCGYGGLGELDDVVDVDHWKEIT